MIWFLDYAIVPLVYTIGQVYLPTHANTHAHTDTEEYTQRVNYALSQDFLGFQ